MSAMQFGDGRLGNWSDEISLNGEDWEKNICPHFLQTLLGNGRCNDGSLLKYFATLTGNADSLFRRCLYLGVPCRGSRFWKGSGCILVHQMLNVAHLFTHTSSL